MRKYLFAVSTATVLAACAHPASTPAMPSAEINEANRALPEYQQVITAARWQSYRCNSGKTLEARYHAGEATAIAQVRFDQQTLTLDYDGEKSNTEFSAFSNDHYTWTISNNHIAQFYPESNGFLIRRNAPKANGATAATDETLFKNCMPVRS